MDFPLDYVRGCFPSIKGSPTIHFDNVDASEPLAAVSAFDETGYEGDVDALLRDTRESLAFFVNSNVEWAEEEIVIAADAATLAERLRVALTKDVAGDADILTTDLADDQSLAPWGGANTRRWPVKRQTAAIDTDRLGEMLSDETRVVVVSKGSRILGSIVELLPVALGIQGHDSALVVDWTAFMPHGAVDVRFLRTDFLIASTTLFFGADVGFLWGKRERMNALRKSAPELFEGVSATPPKLAGLGAALRYVEELGLITQEMQLQPSEDYGRRRHMRRGMQAIRHYERSLTALALRRLESVPGVSVFGVRDPDAAALRMPHILFRVDRMSPEKVSAALAEQDVLICHGNGDAPRLMRSLGLPEEEGGCSLAMLHYNSESEIERFADVLHEIAPHGAAVSG